MSNTVHYELDVLARNPTEINRIAATLNHISAQLIHSVAERFGQTVSEIAEALNDLVWFEVVCNLGDVDASLNKARRFRTASKDRHRSIIEAHVLDVSKAFPMTVFLLTFRDTQYRDSEKWVVRAGKIAQGTQDYCQRGQGVNWALLDIFVPFLAEYDEELGFGSLWNDWLEDVITAAMDLKGTLDSLETEDERMSWRGNIPVRSVRIK